MKRIALFFAVLVAMTGIATAQNITVKGSVSDRATGDPLGFVSVVTTSAGKPVGTTTDANGEYTITAPSNGTLTFSFIGYKDVVVNVNGQININVELDEDTTVLDDVVVVAYGVSKKESVTGALTTVKSDAIAKRPVSSATSALEGQSAGIIVNNSGAPGDGASIYIRGLGSVNGTNAPLYVIDGVPFSGSISDINPTDIESLTVLKDATSAALYGSRASNGVILITTKRAKTDKLTVSANVSNGIYSKAIPEYETLGADSWMETMFQGYANSLLTNGNVSDKASAIALAQKTFVSDIAVYNIYNKEGTELFDSNGKLVSGAKVLSGYDDLNWYDYMERVGYRQDYNVSAQAATQKSNFYFSVGYLNEQGYVKYSSYDRLSARAKVDVTPKKWINLGLNLSGSLSNYENTSTSSSAYANPFMFARNIAPIYPVYLHDMSTGEYLLDENGNKQYDQGTTYGRPQFTGRHWLWEKELNQDKTGKTTLDANAYIKIFFLKDFTFSVTGDLGLRNTNSREYSNAVVGDGAGLGRANREQYWYKNWTVQEMLNYNHTFSSKHNVEALLGHEAVSYNYEYQYIFKQGETFANGYELSNFATINNADGYQSGYTLDAYIARLKYGYDSRYFLEGSFSRNGSSRFASQTRWGNFWSLGGTWVISREPFMSTVNWADNVKFRASYGQVGNDRSAGYYAYMSLYDMDTNNGSGALYKIQNEADDLQWESANSLSVALEGRLFNRWNLSLEYFNKYTHDLIFSVNQPLSAGATSTSDAVSTVDRNLGDVSNQGVEITTDVDIISNKDWRWNVGANFTYQKNKIVRLPEENREDGIVSGVYKYAEGHGIYDFYTYQYAGVDMMTGRALYELNDEDFYVGDTEVDGKTQVPASWVSTINGKDYVMNTTYAKKDWSGSAVPKVYGSFSTSLSYKNFELSALFTYALGGKVYDSNYSGLMSNSGNPYSLHADAAKSWTAAPSGMTETSADRISTSAIPVFDYSLSSYTNATSSRWLVSGNYFVIKNINLSYRLPRTFAQKIGVSGISVAGAIENLATFTARKGLNPQYSIAGSQSNSFGTARVFSLSLNFTL